MIISTELETELKPEPPDLFWLDSAKMDGSGSSTLKVTDQFFIFCKAAPVGSLRKTKKKSLVIDVL